MNKTRYQLTYVNGTNIIQITGTLEHCQKIKVELAKALSAEGESYYNIIIEEV